MQACDFIRFLWASLGDEIATTEGLVTLAWDKKCWKHFPVSMFAAPSAPEDDEELFAELGRRKSVYAHPGLRHPDTPKRGRRSDVVALAAFVLDIDTAAPPGAHKTANELLPKNEDDVLAILEVAPEIPSLIVHSGYGYQPWWVFSEPIWCKTGPDRKRAQDAYKKFEEPFLKRAKGLGFHMDSTASIEHEFRLPGTLNAKLENL
jgi:hypothetical protein